MTVKEVYEITGSDFNNVINRLMKDTLVKKFSLKFLNDKSFSELKAALNTDNLDEAFRAAHTLKGVCQNLAFTRLAGISSDITEELRSKNLEGAKSLFHEVEKRYIKLNDELAKLSSLTAESPDHPE